MNRRIHVAAVCAAVLTVTVTLTVLYAQQRGASPVTIGASDIGGQVSSATGPEAGVWVIAETTGLPTKFAKVVVTDQEGRYLIPDLPKASYDVWVRGYGLVDSPKVKADPGKNLNLTAITAPTPAAAAEYYPAFTGTPCFKFLAATNFQGPDHKATESNP